jgi:hypothetical protein
MKNPTGQSTPEQGPIPESGTRPTASCLAAGEDLRAALLLLCDDSWKSPPEREFAPKARVWSIAPVPRKPRRP